MIRLASKWPFGSLWGEFHRCGVRRWVKRTSEIDDVFHRGFNLKHLVPIRNPSSESRVSKLIGHLISAVNPLRELRYKILKPPSGNETEILALRFLSFLFPLTH